MSDDQCPMTIIGHWDLVIGHSVRILYRPLWYIRCMSLPKSFIVIPARLASTRLPRKLLLAETGKPLIQHTYEAARQAKLPSGLVVAADHEEIAQAVHQFGGQVVMTSPTCASGTDRVAEVARTVPEVDIFVNVQGDEPEINPIAIDLAVEM